MTVTATCTAEAVRDWLIQQIGTVETPVNIQPYGADYGWNGVAWCQILQWDAQVHAGDTGFYKTASTIDCANWFRKNNAWGTPSIDPPMGSLVYFDWGQGIAHVGFVEGRLADGRIATIEGNTDYAGGNSGGRVMRQNRGANIAGYGLITYQPARPVPQEDDMACVYSLNEKLTYPGLGDLAPGYAIYVVGNVRQHVDSTATENQRVHDGCPARGVSALEMAAILDMTVPDIHKLIKS